MPTLSVTFNIPAGAVPRLQELLVIQNEARVDGGAVPYADVNDMAEDILKTRLKLLVKEGERAEVFKAKQALRTATPAQIQQIRDILENA